MPGTDPTSASTVLYSAATVALTGTLCFVGGIVTQWYKDQHEDRQKLASDRDLQRRLHFEPLKFAIDELTSQLEVVRRQLEEQAEKDFVWDLHHADGKYYLRKWFLRLKQFVTDGNSGWTEGDRFMELSLNAGGEGYQALSTLYLTAVYFHYATRIRFDPVIGVPHGIREPLLSAVNQARSIWAELRFFPLTQDSTGPAMKSGEDRVVDYRDFVVRLTAPETRGWFLRLTDFYIDLHMKSD
jgi:hypothetical protein